METKDIDKASRKFSDDVKSKKLHSPKIGDLIFYNVWRALAASNDPIKADKLYWESSGLINHEFSPIVKLNFIKKIFAKVMYYILKRVMK